MCKFGTSTTQKYSKWSAGISSLKNYVISKKIRRLKHNIKIVRSGEDYITRSFIICAPHQLLIFGWSNQEWEWQGVCHVRETGAYRVMVGRPEGKRQLWRPRHRWEDNINPLNAELNPIRHLLALAGAHHFVDVSRIRVKVGLHEVG
jgi:hypothetical protein